MFINSAFDTLVPSISLQSYRVGQQAFNPYKRAAHAYVNIIPSGYNNVGKRAKQWTLDILKGKDADINHPKWTLEQLGDRVKEYIPSTVKNREVIASRTRDDAWRIYNGLEPKHGMYIKNSDGTYSYNMDKINELSENTFKPIMHMNPAPYDYVTSAGGGLTKFENKVIDTQSQLGLGTSRTYGIQHIEDIWDLHPFSGPDDLISRRIPLIELPFKSYDKAANSLSLRLGKLSNNFKYDNKQIKKYLDKSTEYEHGMFDPEMFPRSNTSYKIGEVIGNISNKIKPTKQYWEYSPLKRLNEYGKNLEAGKILGGKPFKMSTDIPYTEYTEVLENPVTLNLPSLKSPIKVLAQSKVDYGFVLQDGVLLPSKVLLYPGQISFDSSKLHNIKISKNIINNRAK